MATSWVEEGALADMKYRLDKLRIDQSKQKSLDEEDEPEKVDTLKLLQSKFGSMVYDPTSPMQRAYERGCARTGRRKSIEFEDLYMSEGSGLQLHDNHYGQSSASSSQRSGRPPQGAAGHPRMRKSSDPAQYYRKQGLQPPSDLLLPAPRSARHGPGPGHDPQAGPGPGPHGRGLMSVPVSEEDRKLIDQKLARISGVGAEDGTQQPRRRKISSPSKFPATKR